MIRADISNVGKVFDQDFGIKLAQEGVYDEHVGVVGLHILEMFRTAFAEFKRAIKNENSDIIEHIRTTKQDTIRIKDVEYIIEINLEYNNMTIEVDNLNRLLKTV